MGSSWGQNSSIELPKKKKKNLATAVPTGRQHQLVRPAQTHQKMRDQVVTSLVANGGLDYFAGKD